MILFLILLVSQLITIEDLGDFWGNILNIQQGTLSRWEYFGCTWISIWAVSFIGSIFLANIGMSFSSTRTLEYYLAYGFLYVFITFIHLSGFLRRCNDACLSKWYALVFLVPGIGHILAFIVALMPSGFGSPY